MPPPILAENFGNLAYFVVGVPVIAALGAALSFIPSSRGRALGPVLAAPAIGIGLLFSFFATTGHAPWWMVMLSLLPAVLGIVSIGRWSQQRERS